MRLKTADTSELNSLSILRVAEDWGIETVPRTKRGLYTIKCPDPKHSDKNLGNCLLTDDGHRNSFHCFACGAKGGPIDLVMLVSKCGFGEAKDLLAARYGLVKEIEADSSKSLAWEGLTNEEYALLGMKPVLLQSPYKTNEWGEGVCRSERLSLREFAKENPLLHDDILLTRYVGMVDALILAKDMIEHGEFCEIGIDANFDDAWKEAFATLATKYRRLLYKGLMDKTVYPFTQEDKMAPDAQDANLPQETSPIEKKLEAEIVRILLGKGKKNKKRTA